MYRIIRKITAIQILVSVVVLGLVSGCGSKENSKAATVKAMIYHCPMHPNYLSSHQGDCPICGMKLVPVNNDDSLESGNSGAVRIDPAMIQSSGVQTEKAIDRILTREIRTSATIAPDERRMTSISTKIMGYVETLHVNYTGQQVKKGDVLYDLYSPDLISAEAEYLDIYNNAAIKDSGSLLRSSRERLRNWDMTDAQISELEKRGAPAKTIPVVSNADGLVTEKMILQGQKIEPGMTLYKLVDYSRVWVEAALYQQDVPLVALGQKGTIEIDNFRGETFKGIVTYLAPELSSESRTMMVRLELTNTADVKIKPGMSATLSLHADIKNKTVTVPDMAIIYSGTRAIVVVAKGNGYFLPREITVGQSAQGYTQVLKGIKAGDEIVVSSQFLIDSESNLKVAVMKMSDNKNVSRGDDAKQQMKYDTSIKNVNAIDTHGDADVNASKITTSKPLYICPMDTEIKSDHMGKCPKCGMNLVLKNKGS